MKSAYTDDKSNTQVWEIECQFRVLRRSSHGFGDGKHRLATLRQIRLQASNWPRLRRCRMNAGAVGCRIAVAICKPVTR